MCGCRFVGHRGTDHSAGAVFCVKGTDKDANVLRRAKFVWCDFNDRLLLPGGTLSKTMMPDLLHPGPYGYEIWAAAVVPELKKALGIRQP